MEDKTKKPLLTFEVVEPNKTQEQKKRKRDLPVHERPDFYLMILAGCIMSFQAGFINVISILKTGVTISHNTGSSSKLGISIGNIDKNGALLGGGLILSFLAGGTLIGFFIRKQVFDFNRKYGIFLMLEALILFFFKYAFDLQMNNLAVMFGSFACGLQNALLTNLSGAVVRTTHVTGMMTDTGLVLGNWIRLGSEFKETWRLKVLVPIIIMFICGAAVSSVLFNHFNYQAIWFAVFFIGLFGFLIILWRLLRKYKYDKFRQFKEKLIGNWGKKKEIKENANDINTANNNNNDKNKNENKSDFKTLNIK